MTWFHHIKSLGRNRAMLSRHRIFEEESCNDLFSSHPIFEEDSVNVLVSPHFAPLPHYCQRFSVLIKSCL